MVFLLAVLAGAGFGGGDQYLGSLSAMPWATWSSLLSAPWLLLPFAFGCTQLRPRRAMLIGLVATMSGLLGYGAMTLTPIENVHLSQDSGAILALVRSEAIVIVGGLITGPLYGWLGQRWRGRRAWVSAIAVAGAVCLEPLAERAAGRLPTRAVVWIAEVVAGLAIAAYFLVAGLSWRRTAA
jgi:hypothetical protein